METKQSQIKINLSANLKSKIQVRAKKYDLTMAGYLKHLAVNDIRVSDVPVFKPSASSIRALKEAMKEEKEGKLKEMGYGPIKRWFFSFHIPKLERWK